MDKQKQAVYQRRFAKDSSDIPKTLEEQSAAVIDMYNRAKQQSGNQQKENTTEKSE